MDAVTITKPPTNVNHQPQARSEPAGGASARVERSTADPQLSVTTIPGQDLRVSGPTAAAARTAASVASHPSWDPSCPLRRTGPSDDHDTQDPISVIAIAKDASRGQVVTRSQVRQGTGSQRRHQGPAAATATTSGSFAYGSASGSTACSELASVSDMPKS